MDDLAAVKDADTDSFDRAIGACFFMGFDGTEVTPQIRTLIVEHHLGAILLTTKNLKSM
jgi:beta-N-acetylhexosaminidase